MQNKLSAEMLADLERLTHLNTVKDQEVLDEMGKRDEEARHLQPRARGEYQQFKQFFNGLVYHENQVRFFSYLGPDRQSWFFFPMVDTDEGLAFIMLGMYTLKEDEPLLDKLSAHGFQLIPGFRNGAIKIRITSCQELQVALTAIQEHHDGYLVPGADAWLETLRTRQGEIERNKCAPTHPALQILPVPDCWI